jgi:hypothetical protein
MQCETCLKTSSIVRDGERERFCQQCGRFHPLEDFDGDKRSCRIRLMRHNNRRRKKAKKEDGPAKKAEKVVKVSGFLLTVGRWICRMTPES